AGIIAQSIREGLHLDPLQNICMLLVGSLKPGKYLVVIAESDIGLDKRCSRNVLLLPALFQFINQTKRVGPPACVSVGPGQNADGARTSMAEGGSSLQGRNGLLRFFFTEQ